MNLGVSLESILPLREQLNRHPVYAALHSLSDLRQFMAHHVFSVWDFMSLLKFLQGRLAPVSIPWAPVGDTSVRRFINDIVLEEESDMALPDASGRPSYASHFELYVHAMREVGADCEPALQFAGFAASNGFLQALAHRGEGVPSAARHFMMRTFAFIDTGKPHIVAAAFALGREHIIPPMFRSLLQKMAIDKHQAPTFHYYLQRHIHLDEDHHGPLSMRMLNILCQGDDRLIAEAEEAARQALEARMAFWDGVLVALSR